MIDVYVPAGVFDDKCQLARRLAAAVMEVERVPDVRWPRPHRRHTRRSLGSPSARRN